jgi:hypothetical protein
MVDMERHREHRPLHVSGIRKEGLGRIKKDGMVSDRHAIFGNDTVGDMVNTR